MFYKHYKGNEYFVLGVTLIGVDKSKTEKFIQATHTETEETINVYMYDAKFYTDTNENLVLYIDQSGNYWVRPFDMFFEQVEVDGQLVRRFTLISR
jgi:hypothetical protein